MEKKQAAILNLQRAMNHVSIALEQLADVELGVGGTEAEFDARVEEAVHGAWSDPKTRYQTVAEAIKAGIKAGMRPAFDDPVPNTLPEQSTGGALPSPDSDEPAPETGGAA